MRSYEHVLYSYIDCFQFPFSLRSVDNRNEERNEKVSTTKVNMGLKDSCLRPSPKDNFAKATYYMSGDLMEIILLFFFFFLKSIVNIRKRL